MKKRILLCALALVALLGVLSGCDGMGFLTGQMQESLHTIRYTIAEDQVLFVYEGLTVSVKAGTYGSGDPDFHVKNESTREYWVAIDGRIFDDECEQERNVMTILGQSASQAFYDTILANKVKAGDDCLLNECESNWFVQTGTSGGLFSSMVMSDEPIYRGKLEYRFALYAVTEESTEGAQTEAETAVADEAIREADGKTYSFDNGVTVISPSLTPSVSIREEDLLYKTEFITIKTTDYDKVDYSYLPEGEPLWEKDGLRVWYSFASGDTSDGESLTSRAFYAMNGTERELVFEVGFYPVEDTDLSRAIYSDAKVYAGKKSGWVLCASPIYYTVIEGGEQNDTASSPKLPSDDDQDTMHSSEDVAVESVANEVRYKVAAEAASEDTSSGVYDGEMGSYQTIVEMDGLEDESGWMAEAENAKLIIRVFDLASGELIAEETGLTVKIN